MNPWFAKAVILIASIILIVIRAPHGQRSRMVAVSKSQRGPLEIALLTIAWIAFFIPLVWIVTPLFAFADYPLRLVPFLVGSACLAVGLWLFYRSHADLGTNWSISLEVREKHHLVTHGVYRWIRHPMYLALLIYSAGQALVIPNWFAGLSNIVAMVVLVALRLYPEEQMMIEEFGEDYEAYKGATKRLIPGVW